MSRYGGDPRPSDSHSGYGGDPRSSDSHLGYGGGGGQRWDPERFSRERERAERFRCPPVVEQDRFEEHDRFQFRGGPSGGAWKRDSSADGFSYRGGGGGRGDIVEERDRFFTEERYGPPARQPGGGPHGYYEDGYESMEASPSRGQMVPFEGRRRQSITAERGYLPPARWTPPRPGIIRRQSSLDTFDRKPMLRYGDRIPNPPETIVIPASAGGRRRRSPPRYVERDYAEEIRIAEPDYYGDDDFRGYKEREVETVRRRKSGTEIDYKVEEGFQVELEPERPFPRKGKTRMPKRLVSKRAIIELGYPFEEEESTIIILKALGKEHIDEVIRVSKEMKETGGESRTTYMINAPTQPAAPEVIEHRKTEIVISSPPQNEVPRSVREWDDGAHLEKGGGHSEHGGGSVHGEHSRSRSEKRSLSPIEIVRKPSRSRHRAHSSATHHKLVLEEEVGESNSMHGPLAIIAPRDHRKDERAIKAEIRALEAEKKALRLEREREKEHKKADRYREEEIIIEKDRDVIRIEKDRKAPNPKLLKAMLATLT